jgi:protoporphyrinogen oxidase
MIIAGAGPAGLTAAYKLLTETDVKPIIYEESDMIGGISKTVEHNGNRIDIGGHRFFSKNQDVMDFWEKLMPVQGAPSSDDRDLGREKPLVPGGPDPEKTDRTLLIRHRVSRIFYLRKFFDYPISLKWQTFANMGFARTMSAGFGYIGSALHKRHEVTLADFMINRFGRPLYEMFFEDYTKKVWGREPSAMSADWGAQRIKGLSLWKTVMAAFKKGSKPEQGSVDQQEVETSLIEQFWYPKKGPGQLWETLADEVVKLGGEIHFNAKVVGVSTNAKGDGIDSFTIEHKGVREQIVGDYFISTMPVKDLVDEMGQGVPADIKRIADGLPYRDFITVGLLLNKLLIKNTTDTPTVNDVVPDCWIYIQERDVKIGRLQVFNNWSPYMVANPKETVWVGLEYFCNEGDEMWDMPDDAFIDFATGELESIDIIDRKDVLDSVRLNIKKAYPAYFDTYEEFPKVREYLDGFGNLFCIGRNGQHRYNNMDHSMLTAFEAVDCVKHNTTDKANVWNVNTEKDYHETGEKKKD